MALVASYLEGVSKFYLFFIFFSSLSKSSSLVIMYSFIHSFSGAIQVFFFFYLVFFFFLSLFSLRCFLPIILISSSRFLPFLCFLIHHLPLPHTHRLRSPPSSTPLSALSPPPLSHPFIKAILLPLFLRVSRISFVQCPAGAGQ